MRQRPNLYRAAYEEPRTGVRKRFTYLTYPDDALRWASDYVRNSSKGYLLGIQEVRPADIQIELELT